MEFFSFDYQKQWKLSVCQKDINQVRVNGLYSLIVFHYLFSILGNNDSGRMEASLTPTDTMMPPTNTSAPQSTGGTQPQHNLASGYPTSNNPSCPQIPVQPRTESYVPLNHHQQTRMLNTLL